MTPRTHTSSGNAVRSRRAMASASSGTDQVGSSASSHSVGRTAPVGTPVARPDLRCLLAMPPPR